MFNKISIVGYSGHGIVVVEAAIKSGIPVKFYCEKAPANINPFKLDYIGSEKDPDFVGWQADHQFILGVGDNTIRNEIGRKILSKKKQVLNIIHPDSSMSDYIEIGIGNFISKNSAINPLVRIGDFCILNTGCIVEHECKLGNAVHIAPGAVLAGNVQVGDFSFIGANSVVKQGVKIGSNVIIGAGSVILNDIADNKTVVGNPGKVFLR